MNESLNPSLVSAALRNAFPYLRLYQGKYFVVKAGGEAFAEVGARRALLEQVSILFRLGIKVVLVHGGGPQLTRTTERLGLEPVFVDGRRVTCAETLEAAAMVLNGSVNASILAGLRELTTSAVGVSGIDGGLITATRRVGAKAAVDFGHVGDIQHVDPRVLIKLLDDGFLPVVSPLCCNTAGELLNVNADSVAARIAVALNAAKLVFMTGAPGVLRDAKDPSSVISYTDIKGLAALKEERAFQDGMLPKVSAIAEALDGGVDRVHVISHRVPDSLLIEVFTNEGAGTLVVLDTQRLTEKEIESSSASSAIAAGGRE
ncbi:MAG: acetylglutamate kinase [Planctomycetota bacterium]